MAKPILIWNDTLSEQKELEKKYLPTITPYLVKGKKNNPIEKISSRPNLLILCYPVISFVNHPHQGCIKNLVGDNPSKEILEFLSSEKNVKKDTPPCFIWHTQDDDVVSVFHSISFALSLKERNIDFQLHIFDNGPHGLGLAENNPSVSKWTLLCEDWLRENNF
ncbi:MAG: prolyl oligopeptidase family serine peptidase [Candidatus Omnitrophica bacterium]|nr:prolyl oligopeptidase family serine peptidase [Candidatus Omnitrophota bacterium]